MESNQNQQLKGNTRKTETEWNQTETKSWGKVSNRKPKLNGIQPIPSIERYQPEKHDVMESNQNQYLKGTVERSQTENQSRKESNRNQELKGVAMYQFGIKPEQLKGIKPNTEICWNQTETKS
jgi:hypothetical protein